MPIIKPLQLEPTSDIEEFAANVFQPKTFSIIYGPTGVGKTALLYKLLYPFYKTTEIKEGIFIVLDSEQCYQYYQSKISKTLHITSIKEKYTSLGFISFKMPDIFPLLYFINLPILTSIKDTNFVLVDALQKFVNKSWEQKAMQNLVKVADSGIPVVVTMDKKPELSHLIEYPAVKIQSFQLERPEFLGGEITEFGDTRLIKDE